ncbi:MAG: transposase [Drouetiella hepatica Uher 2000/2452]|uniref:Transposase n=1 Tax=Drouetiella hepatica Uher 2000/2452 TaxID=904376 RepID=A0A951QCN8_9CYAN|nr:transposase [Drouetiella hepatica Uher 2000/2452]
MILPPNSIHRRGDLNESQWQRLRCLLPAQKPPVGRPSHDHRRIINGILWIVRTGAPIALRAFKKGETCPNAMGHGQPCQDAFTAGANKGCGSRFCKSCNSLPMLKVNSIGLFPTFGDLTA